MQKKKQSNNKKKDKQLKEFGKEIAQRWIDWIACNEFKAMTDCDFEKIDLKFLIVSILTLNDTNFKRLSEYWAQKHSLFLEIKTKKQQKKEMKKIKKEAKNMQKEIKKQQKQEQKKARKNEKKISQTKHKKK